MSDKDKPQKSQSKSDDHAKRVANLKASIKDPRVGNSVKQALKQELTRMGVGKASDSGSGGKATAKLKAIQNTNRIKKFTDRMKKLKDVSDETKVKVMTGAVSGKEHTPEKSSEQRKATDAKRSKEKAAIGTHVKNKGVDRLEGQKAPSRPQDMRVKPPKISTGQSTPTKAALQGEGVVDPNATQESTDKSAKEQAMHQKMKAAAKKITNKKATAAHSLDIGLKKSIDALDSKLDQLEKSIEDKAKAKDVKAQIRQNLDRANENAKAKKNSTKENYSHDENGQWKIN